MRSFKVSGTTAAQWSYYLARLKCGLAKGKHIEDNFGSKTALVWLTRSGNADQLMKQSHGNGAQKCLGVEGTEKRTQNRFYVFMHD